MTTHMPTHTPTTARGRRTASALLLTALLAGGTTAVVAPTAADAAASASTASRTASSTASYGASRTAVGGALKITPADPIEFELTRFTGRLVTQLKRPVLLQVATKKGRFTTVSTSATKRSGRFTFREIVQPRSGVTRVRVLAPAHRVGITTYPAIATSVARTRVQTQAAAISFPDPAVVGRPFTVIANLTPVRPGRVVQVQRLDGTTWTTVASGAEDASGVFTTTLTETVAGPKTYRASAPARKGAKAVTSDPFSVTVSAS